MNDCQVITIKNRIQRKLCLIDNSAGSVNLALLPTVLLGFEYKMCPSNYV